MGRYSRTWRYLRSDQSAVAAIFYPYPRWKEVKLCYSCLGWTVQDRVIHNADPASETGPYVTARLYQPGKKSYGYLVFQIAMPRPAAHPLRMGSGVARTRLEDPVAGLDRAWPRAPHEPDHLVQLS